MESYTALIILALLMDLSLLVYVFLTFPQVAQWQRIHMPMQETQIESLGGKIPWKKKWQSTPVFSPGKTHGCKASDTAEHTHILSSTVCAMC